MKTLNKAIVLLLTLTLLTPVIGSAKGRNQRASNKPQTVELSAEQQATLLWMREEEKLARDIYLELYKEWNQAVFLNIANAEQQHMDAVLKKIDSFGLTDPVLTEDGVFSNIDLQDFYDEFVGIGRETYVDALIVGAIIEDMDISDLLIAIENTDNLALKTTYESLLEGSKNHLRAFIGLLEKQGEIYEPEYISQELFDAIISL